MLGFALFHGNPYCIKPISDKCLNGKLGIRPSRIIPVGESMGGAVAIEWCAHDHFRAVVIISPSLCFSRVLSRPDPDDPLDKEVVGN